MAFKFLLIKSKVMGFLGLSLFLVLTTPYIWLPFATAVNYPLAIQVFQYINEHQLGIILLGLPLITWEMIKDWRWIGLAMGIVMIFLAFKTKIFGG